MAFEEHLLFIRQLNSDKETIPQQANEVFRRFNEASNRYTKANYELDTAKRANNSGDQTQRFSNTHLTALETELQQARNDIEMTRSEMNAIMSKCRKNCTDIEIRKNQIASTVNSVMSVNKINGSSNIKLDQKTQAEILNYSKTYLSVYGELNIFFRSLMYNIANINIPQGNVSSGGTQKSLYRHNESEEKTLYKYH